MSCPTCDHTVQHLPGTRAVFWCPRCGTLLTYAEGGTSGKPVVEAPKLVERCRVFGRHFETGAPNETLRDLWASLGVAESIDTPGRPS